MKRHSGVCIYCGTRIYSCRSDKKFCSPQCYNRYNKSGKSLKMEEDRTKKGMDLLTKIGKSPSYIDRI